ncbi:hypothetical protein GGI07_001345 [Coemansia sp. Benny D115]|nr:hypothetical protein GGI07_001345 [Coemansia sp. Benny D115]
MSLGPAAGKLAASLRTSVAPMIDVTDPFFLHMLQLISPFGNHELWTEMVHANIFSRAKMHLDPVRLAKHIPVSQLQSFSHGTVVQIGASDPADASAAVTELRRLGARHVNLNCGCPSRNVQMGSFGAVLMTRPADTAAVVRAMVDAATQPTPDDLPKVHVSVKCRIGVDDDETPEFLARFIDAVLPDKAAGPGSVSLVLHARRAWLNGLSPAQNRTVPVLNHERVYEMARRYPHTRVVANGGIDSVAAVQEHLRHVDGVMVGRKVREDPWFLSELDQHVYGHAADTLPTREQVLDSYIQYADQMHSELSVRHTLLARPLYALFRGRKAKALRRSLGQLISKASAATDTPSSVLFSEIVREAVHAAEAEHQAAMQAKQEYERSHHPHHDHDRDEQQHEQIAG